MNQRDLDRPWASRPPRGMVTNAGVGAQFAQPIDMTGITAPPTTQANLDETNFVVDALKYGDYAHQPFTAGTGISPIVLGRPSGKRVYLLITNNHPTQALFVGFGVQPNANLGVTIQPGGNYEPGLVCPQNDIYLVGAAAGTNGCITYCNSSYGAQ